jgi:hypothetical protein
VDEKTYRIGHWRSQDLETLGAAFHRYEGSPFATEMTILKQCSDTWYKRSPHEATAATSTT